MPRVNGAEGSRAATDRLLADLRAGRWRPAAWLRFFADAGRRSSEQVVVHRTAMFEVSILHAAAVAASAYNKTRATYAPVGSR